MAPKSLGRYELIEVLGTGAFATVWRATDPVLEEDVAIKVLADNWARDPEVRQRFLSEARLALKATSPHLVRVYHVVDDDELDAPYIVMQLADSGTLEDRIRQRKLHPYSTHEALALLANIARTVGALHENGLIHRDLKPGNVLFQTRNGTEQPLLGDFGLARVTDRSALTMVAGTPAYTAPEQAAGLTQLTEQADLYSLGVMFLEMIGGETPEHRTMAEAANGLDLDGYLTDHRIALDPEVKAFIARLLDPKPENRPANANEVIDQATALLAQVQHDEHATVQEPQRQLQVAEPHVSSTPLDAPTAATEPASAKLVARAIIAIPILLVLFVVGFFVISAVSSGTEPEQTTESVPSETTDADVSTTTTQAVVADATTTSTTTTEPLVASPGAEIPEDFPIPTAALAEIALSNGNTLQTFTIAGVVADVERFYTEGEWPVIGRNDADGLVTLTLAQGESTVNVSLEDFTNSTGAALVRLVVTPIT